MSSGDPIEIFVETATRENTIGNSHGGPESSNSVKVEWEGPGRKETRPRQGCGEKLIKGYGRMISAGEKGGGLTSRDLETRQRPGSV